MKDDAPLPDAVPHKRRHVERLLDRHIAMWLASDTLTPSERRRLEEEKERRKRLSPDMRVGLVVDEAGVTPEQLVTVREKLGESGATEILHAGVSSSKLHGACKAVGVPVVVHHGQPREVIRQADRLLATPVGTKAGPVWDLVKYARHRRVPVVVVMPDGRLEAQE